MRIKKNIFKCKDPLFVFKLGLEVEKDFVIHEQSKNSNTTPHPHTFKPLSCL